MHREIVFCVLAVAIAAAPFACGARTNLDVSIETSDAALAEVDAHRSDVVGLADVVFEHSPVVRDAIPPFDGFRSGVPQGCDAGASFVYVLTQASALYAFDPIAVTFTKVGDVACPSTQAPHSMAIDRHGHAYSIFADSTLYLIDIADAACSTTSFTPATYGFPLFGMAYANVIDAGDTMFAAINGTFQAHSLAVMDTTTFALTNIDDFHPTIRPSELTGTGDGRLFAFYVNNGPGSHLVELDVATATVIGDVALSVGTAQTLAFAFAFWGGSFWIFTAESNSASIVTRFNLATFPHETKATTFTEVIVGAGVSTCAPE